MKNDLEKKLSSLGFFAFSEKKNLSNRIDLINKELTKIEAEIKTLFEEYSLKIDKLGKKEKKVLKKRNDEIESKYTVSESPFESQKRLEKYKECFCIDNEDGSFSYQKNVNYPRERLIYCAIEVMGGDIKMEESKFVALGVELLGLQESTCSQVFRSILRRMRLNNLIDFEYNYDGWIKLTIV